ncbi:hypothetical protein KZZ08_06785 [Roseovarius mucosus]|uniref:hypothetical protein n=1 Tax=Roseovarius mucosus TaxID=215743 RepID=UPI001C5EC927|nr:hypothetical protein [Roseovarius mucosus]MBW4973314.1 hypothetical protein [Roseovarius mucosus]
MPKYILDTCVDIEPTQSNFPKYFFADLHANTRVKLVFGGTTAINEVRKKAKLRELLNNLRDRNQLITVCTEKVDTAEATIEERIKDIIGQTPPECDDLHVFALAKVSGCLNVITRDNRMAACRKNIRSRIGHEYCPDIIVIQNENVYKRTKQD